MARSRADLEWVRCDWLSQWEPPERLLDQHEPTTDPLISQHKIHVAPESAAPRHRDGE